MIEKTPRQIVDPNSTLPEVALLKDESKKRSKGTLTPTPMLITYQGETIGKATFSENRTTGEAWFNGINIDEDKRGQGFGLATYLSAIELAHDNGETFRTHDWSQTEAAAKVWGKFVDAGIAEVIEPLTLASIGQDGTKKFSGHLAIPPSLHAQTGTRD